MFIYYQNNKIELPDKCLAQDLAEKLSSSLSHQAYAASINGKLSDLSTPLQEGDQVTFYHFTEKAGKEIFWHTSAHILALAITRLWPEALPTIGPPIENGFYYDFANLHLSEEDFPNIEKEIKNILFENFKPQKIIFQNKKKALQEFQKNPYKQELIEEIPETEAITAYRIGEFLDLCRGPHLPSLAKIKAFKILKTSGAYWKGAPEREMLTRIYAISFPSQEEMKEYLRIQEEAKKRDHRLIGVQLDLLSFKEEAPGMPFIYPRGMRIWSQLTDYWKEVHHRAGYGFIQTPQMMSQKLWEQSGHWEYYREHMFTCEIDRNRILAVKPMNCPGCILYYKSHSWSYRKFPLRVAEIGHVHRHEPTGALSGLFRVQGFHVDDAHHFMRPQDIVFEILYTMELAEEIYQTFGLHYTVELSTRPEKSIGTDEEWAMLTQALETALIEKKVPYKINEGDGAFYGPKIDFHILDILGRAWQCGTIQMDLSLPERFHLEYKDTDGLLKKPVMMHRAIFGSIERFFGILIEHFGGKFPLWLSPHPVRMIPIADRHIGYAKEVAKKISQAHFWCDIDDSSESVSKKVRLAQLLKINYLLTVGDKEVENKTVTLRTLDGVVHGELAVSPFLSTITSEYQTRSLFSPYQQKEHS